MREDWRDRAVWKDDLCPQVEKSAVHIDFLHLHVERNRGFDFLPLTQRRGLWDGGMAPGPEAIGQEGG